MKITKVGGVLICATGQKGKLYKVKGNLDSNFIKERIKNANKNTTSQFSIFIKNKTNFKSNLKEEGFYKWLDRNLKPPFKKLAYKEAYGIYQIHQKNFYEFDRSFQKIPEIENQKKAEIKKIIGRRNYEKLEKSIENQKMPIYFKINQENQYEPKFSNQALDLFFKDFANNPMEAQKNLYNDLEGFFTIIQDKLSLLRQVDQTININGTMVTKGMYEKKSIVNCLNNVARETDGKTNYFHSKLIDFAKEALPTGEFVEPYIVEKMVKNLQGKLKGYITYKIIQRGKYIHYHDISKSKELNWTSFHLEMIEATEMLRRKLAIAYSYAYLNFRNVWEGDKECKNDCLCGKPDYVQEIGKDKSAKMFFGGERFYADKYGNPDINTVMKGLNQSLYALRNNIVHYEYRKASTIKEKAEVVEELIKKEFELRKYFVEEKFRSNEVQEHFKQKDIDCLISNICVTAPETKAYFPKFTRLKKNIKAALPDIPSDQENRYFFLFQEIYYNEFLASERTVTNDDENGIGEGCRNENGRKYELEAYQKLVKQLGSNQYSLTHIAEHIHKEYMRQNQGRRKEDPKKSDNLNLIFQKTVTNVFLRYVKKHYPFLAGQSGESLPLKETKGKWDADLYKGEQYLELYAMAKFTLPKALSDLTHYLAKFKQFRADIIYRHKLNCLEENKAFVEFADNIAIPIIDKAEVDNSINNLIMFLKLCQQSVGWVAPPCEKTDGEKILHWAEFFENKEEYRQYISAFVHEDVVDKEIYMNGANPICRKHIILSKMYRTKDFINAVYGGNKVVNADITQYEKNHEISLPSFSNNKKLTEIKDFEELKTEINNREKQLKYVQNTHKVELYYIQTLNSLYVDLYSNLLTWNHIWERDMQFFMYGLEKDKSTIDKIFQYGEVVGSPKDKGSMGKKVNCYIDTIASKPKKEALESMFFREYNKSVFLRECNSGNNDYKESLRKRNDIAHFNNYGGKCESIFKLYNHMRKQMSYHRKHKNAVMAKLRTTLERYGMDINKALEAKSDSFDFKLNRGKIKKSIEYLDIDKNIVKGKIKEEISALKIKNNKYSYEKLTDEMKQSITLLLEYKK